MVRKAKRKACETSRRVLAHLIVAGTAEFRRGKLTSELMAPPRGRRSHSKLRCARLRGAPIPKKDMSSAIETWDELDAAREQCAPQGSPVYCGDWHLHPLTLCPLARSPDRPATCSISFSAFLSSSRVFPLKLESSGIPLPSRSRLRTLLAAALRSVQWRPSKTAIQEPSKHRLCVIGGPACS